jgi:hypothetical protein
MSELQERLHGLVPEPVQRPDWDAVLKDARSRRRSPLVHLAIATIVDALAALFIVAPWKASERVSILDRALAAAGDGPVLHVVFRGGWGATLVDLKTGERQPVYGEREVWFDPNRNLVHQISRFGGVVEGDELYERNKGDRELTALWRDYRPALENGTARLVGEDVVDGIPVYWIIVRAQMLPDVADHKNHEFAQQVAISRETFKPVAMKYTRDRQPSPDSIEHIARFETISVEEANFTSAPEKSLNGVAMMEGRNAIDISQAAKALGGTPYWLGDRFQGLPLGAVQEVYSATGRQEETLVTGPRAEKMLRCFRSRAMHRPEKQWRKFWRRHCRGLPGAVIRGDKVYEVGPARFGPRQTGLSLFYGSVGDDPTTFKTEDAAPLYADRNIVVTEKSHPEQRLLGFPLMTYRPPDGSLLLMPGGSGYLVRDGVYISIRAATEKDVLTAARALRTMPTSKTPVGE